jgi:Spy/CpxP family protein refolding chaperone
MKILMNLTTNRMRCAALALCALAIGTTPMWSQAPQDVPPPPPQQENGQWHGRPNMEQMQDRQIEHLQKRLNLTAEQTTQVRAIYQDSGAQMKKLHEDSSLSRDAMHAQMKSIHEASTATIRALLTDDQKPKYDAMIAHEHEHMENRGGGPGAPPPPPAPQS